MKYLTVIFVVFSLLACNAQKTSTDSEALPVSEKIEKARSDESLKSAYFASGCFWCVEAVYESVEGVVEVISGYSGGTEQNPSYKAVSAGRTSHAEAVEVIYDPEKVSFETLVDVFYGSHDPTQVLGQGPDHGAQYRSVAFYTSVEEKSAIEAKIERLYKSGAFADGEIVTEITAFEKFWDAEEYHQDFERRNPNQGYVRAVSIPRLKRFQKQFPDILKKEASH